jgi:hypothetical protein
MQSAAIIPDYGYLNLWIKVFALRTNPLRDPPALPERQQRFDRSGSPQGIISRVFDLQGQVFIVVSKTYTFGIGIAIGVDIDTDSDTDPDNAVRADLSGSQNQASGSTGDPVTF